MITKSDMDKHLVPSLEDLGKESKDCGPNLFPGGETEALDRMERMLKKTVRNLIRKKTVLHFIVCACSWR